MQNGPTVRSAGSSGGCRCQARAGHAPPARAQLIESNYCRRDRACRTPSKAKGGTTGQAMPARCDRELCRWECRRSAPALREIRRGPSRRCAPAGRRRIAAVATTGQPGADRRHRALAERDAGADRRRICARHRGRPAPGRDVAGAAIALSPSSPAALQLQRAGRALDVGARAAGQRASMLPASSWPAVGCARPRLIHGRRAVHAAARPRRTSIDRRGRRQRWSRGGRGAPRPAGRRRGGDQVAGFIPPRRWRWPATATASA